MHDVDIDGWSVDLSPLLSNIYLHYVLDEWFEKVARPQFKGRCLLVRYADDAVMAFEDHLCGIRGKAATNSDRKRPPNPKEGGHPVDRVRPGGVVGNLNGARSLLLRFTQWEVRCPPRDCRCGNSRSSTPEVFLWNERSGDLPLGRDRSHGNRGVCPPGRGDRHHLADPGGARRHCAGAQAVRAGRLQPAAIEAASGRGHIHAELRRRSVTLALLWEEYRGHHPDGYGYSRFCDLYVEWRHGITATMRRPTRPAKSCSWTSPATPCRCSTGSPGRSAPPRSSSRLWERRITHSSKLGSAYPSVDGRLV